MLICNSCNELFEEPHIFKEIHSEFPDSPTEEIPCCPYCKDFDIEKIEECKYCGEYNRSLIDDACFKCRIEVIGKYNSFKHSLPPMEQLLCADIFERCEL